VVKSEDIPHVKRLPIHGRTVAITAAIVLPKHLRGFLDCRVIKAEACSAAQVGCRSNTQLRHRETRWAGIEVRGRKQRGENARESVGGQVKLRAEEGKMRVHAAWEGSNRAGCIWAGEGKEKNVVKRTVSSVSAKVCLSAPHSCVVTPVSLISVSAAWMAAVVAVVVSVAVVVAVLLAVAVVPSPSGADA
jgi:hypothetical protein